MLRFLLIAALSWTVLLPSAWAADIKVAVADFQKALETIDEGKAATSRLETMAAQKRQQLSSMEQQFVQKQEEYQRSASILSDEKRLEKEQELGALQAQFQQAMMQGEGAIQQAYAEEIEKLVGKMKMICTQIAKEKGYDIVLEKTAVVYVGANTVDLTDELVKRYNAAN